MQFKIPHDKNLLCTAVALSLLPLSGTSLAQDDQIEEVVVTGSFIRKSEGFTQASSVVQLTAEDLEAQGTLNMGEVIQNLAFVNGSASAITNTIQGQDSRSSSIDLRGLGASSTLTLLDGKRLVNQNVNALLPSIAIQRLDIVADGAAALYGSEAVAGVVNFVPYKTYDGLKLETFAEGDSRGDWDHHSIQALWGGDVGVLDVVLAGQSALKLGWAGMSAATLPTQAWCFRLMRQVTISFQGAMQMAPTPAIKLLVSLIQTAHQRQIEQTTPQVLLTTR